MKTILLVGLLILSSPAPATSQPFRFTAIPDENTARLKDRFDKIAHYLTQKLGVRVQYVPVKSYSASVAAFKNNEVQLAWFGGLSGVKARRAVPGAVAIAQGEEDLRFVSYFIANTTTGLHPADEFPEKIKGRTFIFGSKGSTSGRLMPEFFIRNHFEAAPKDVFRRVGFSGDHSKTLALVQSGSYEVGALNYKVWENEMAAGNVDTGKVRTIWKTPPYSDYNWTVRGDVEQKYGKGTIEKIKNAFLNMTDRKLLDAFPRTSFIPADNAMYESILKTAIAVGIIEN